MRAGVAMQFKQVLITGGAGFVGSNLALMLKRARPEVEVAALDSLKRRGSELTLPRLAAAGVRFVHGDVRCSEDLEALPAFDLLIDCAAEPSVQAGVRESPRAVLNINLLGSINCLEAARVRGAAFVLLSTSRVYPVRPLNALPYSEDANRFRWEPQPGVPGFSEEGVAEGFPLDGARSFYGASKLAAEQLLQEYVYNYGMKAIINRCGILAGPWQMGKVDQGVVTLWVARHYFRQPLQYIGFGGQGKQVRDLLHVADLFDLLISQMNSLSRWDGSVYNVGGGPQVSVSLLELTALCESVTGHRIPITAVPATSPVDLRIYLTDARKARRDFGWRPVRGAEQIVRDIHRWITEHRSALESVFG
jgi:CDP-paratose 2-epimerase